MDAAEAKEEEARARGVDLERENGRLRESLEEMRRRLDRSLRRELLFRGVDKDFDSYREEKRGDTEGGV